MGICPLLVLFLKHFPHLLSGKASSLLDAFVRSLEQRNELGIWAHLDALIVVMSGRDKHGRRHTLMDNCSWLPSMRLTYSASGSVASFSSIGYVKPIRALLMQRREDPVEIVWISYLP
jgi:hypothetical protein